MIIMLTDKQQFFLDLIINYYKETHILPNINTLKKISNYKSYNSIHKYLEVLENKNYLKYDISKKEISYLKGTINKNKIFKIPFINENKYFNIDGSILNNKEDYYIYKIPNNNLKSFGINKNNLVIVEKNKIDIENKLVLIKQKNTYNLYKCEKKDEFIRLINDIKYFNLGTTNTIVGKVVIIIKSPI